MDAQAAKEQLSSLKHPKVFVFDLDDTVWHGDVDQKRGPPAALGGDGQLLCADGSCSVRATSHARNIFSWLDENGHRVAVASAGGETVWSEKALSLIETESGRSFLELADVREIDYYASKVQTLKSIARRCGCKESEMVFYDNSGSRIREGIRAGVTSQYCPDALTWANFAAGAQLFDQQQRTQPLQSPPQQPQQQQAQADADEKEKQEKEKLIQQWREKQEINEKKLKQLREKLAELDSLKKKEWDELTAEDEERLEGEIVLGAQILELEKKMGSS